MGAAEIAFRSGRALTQQLERARVKRGWTPATGCSLLGTRSLFGDADAEKIAEAWLNCFTPDHEALAKLLDGQTIFFSQTYHLDQPPQWHTDPDTGRTAPLEYGKTINYRDDRLVGNIKVLWELGRHQHLVPLAAAYAVTGEQRYRDAAVAQIDAWVAANPFGIGIHWCSSLELALRGIAWCMVHGLIALRDGPDGLLSVSADRAAMSRSVYEHCHFIRGFLSRHSSANNHLIGELVGLWCLANTFDFGQVSSHWAAFAKAELTREAKLQVTPDGVACEQATHYQLEVLEYLIFAWCVGRRSGSEFDVVVVDRVRVMLAFLHAITPHGGELPQIGDSDEGTVNRFHAGAAGSAERELLEMAAHVFSAHAERKPAEEKAFWYRAIATEGVSTPVPAGLETPRAAQRDRLDSFPTGGYAALRAGGLLVVMDAGPLGYLSIAAHGHADALAFCAAWQADWWLVDPGTYAYHSEPEYRAYFRGTAAHNTATVDARDQSDQGGAFMWTRHAASHLLGSGETEAGGFWAEGSHDGYLGLGLRHRRRVEVGSTGTFTVADRFERSPGRAQHVALHFHFHPTIELSLTEDACSAIRDGIDATLTVGLDRTWNWQVFKGSNAPLLGWYSPGLGRKVPCWTLRGERLIDDQVSIETKFSFAAP